MPLFELRETCGGCPEAYDVYHNGMYVGYMRLRHGYFRVVYDEGGAGETVYEAHPRGDGIFETEERDKHLRAGCGALLSVFTELDGPTLYSIVAKNYEV